jgi:hypothetical protein
MILSTGISMNRRIMILLLSSLILLVISISTLAKANAIDNTSNALTVKVLDASNSRLVDGGCSPSTFFGLVPWYSYLSVTPGKYGCDIAFSFLGSSDGKTPSSIPLVLLAIIDDLLRIAGLTAVFFVIAGGIRYITSQGSPDETAKAQKTITNALIGLVIALISVGIVSFIGNQFGAA